MENDVHESVAAVPLTQRSNPCLTGHEAAERQLLDAFNSKRMHHAWLITGPRGIGKATLAWRMARFVLAHPPVADDGLFGGTFDAKPETLDLPQSHPVFQRVLSGGHADIITVERAVDEKTKKLRSEIVIDDIRQLNQFFSKTAGEGGWRVAIVDAADEMNRNAANALLKILEEPPANALILLVCHTPGRMLPTILSRCRKLKLHPLDDANVSEILLRHFPDVSEADRLRIIRLSHGSPGRAVKLAALKGPALYEEFLALLGAMPGIDIRRLHKFADQLGGRESDAMFNLFGELLEDVISTVVQMASTGGSRDAIDAQEEEIFRRCANCISLDRWFELWEKTCELMLRAEAVNLDRHQTVLNIFHLLETAAQS